MSSEGPDSFRLRMSQALVDTGVEYWYLLLGCWLVVSIWGLAHA